MIHHHARKSTARILLIILAILAPLSSTVHGAAEPAKFEPGRRWPGNTITCFYRPELSLLPTPVMEAMIERAIQTWTRGTSLQASYGGILPVDKYAKCTLSWDQDDDGPWKYGITKIRGSDFVLSNTDSRISRDLRSIKEVEAVVYHELGRAFGLLEHPAGSIMRPYSDDVLSSTMNLVDLAAISWAYPPATRSGKVVIDCTARVLPSDEVLLPSVNGDFSVTLSPTQGGQWTPSTVEDIESLIDLNQFSMCAGWH